MSSIRRPALMAHERMALLCAVICPTARHGSRPNSFWSHMSYAIEALSLDVCSICPALQGVAFEAPRRRQLDANYPLTRKDIIRLSSY